MTTDGSDGAAEALDFVAALLPDADLHLVQSVQITPQLKQSMLRVRTAQDALTTHRDALTLKAGEHLRGLATGGDKRIDG